MAVPDNNLLQTVALFTMNDIGWMLNEFASINLANKKFREFNDSYSYNLGSSITFDLEPRFVSFSGLVATDQSSAQRPLTLTASQAENVSMAYSDQQIIFQVDQNDYLKKFGMAAMKQLGSRVEIDINRNFISGVVGSDPQQSDSFGVRQTTSGPYRWYGNWKIAINSMQELAQSVANFLDYGSAAELKAILPMANIPSIVGTQQNKFTPDANDKMLETWKLGEFSNCEWHRSNLLPMQVAGTVGNSSQVLTLVSVNDTSGNNVTAMTFSGATPNDADAVKAGDAFVFNDGVSGKPNMRYLSFEGRSPTSQPVQFVSTANVAADGSGNVTIPINTVHPLVWQYNNNYNLNNALVPGMQVSAQGSHKAGILYSGNQFFLAMPKLPDQEPWPSMSTSDPDSGASIRHYWGATQPGANLKRYIRDEVHGSCLGPDNSMRYIFPV